MKLKYIVALIATLAITTVFVEAKGNGNGNGQGKRMQKKECAQDCSTCECTPVQKQDCTQERKQTCTKENAGECDQAGSCDKKQGRGKNRKGSCTK